MTKYHKMICALGMALALCTGVSYAQTPIEAGRIKLSFNEAGWVASEELPFNSEVRSAMGTIQGQSKILTLPGPDTLALAQLYVGSTWARSQVYTTGGKCQEDPTVYVRDLNDSKLENYRCVYIGGPYPIEQLLKGPLQDLQKTGQAKSDSTMASTSAYYFFMLVTAKNGLKIHTQGMLAPSFVGLPDNKPVAQVPANLSPAIAAWADKFAESALVALTSFGGGFPVPKVEFSSLQK